MHGREPADVVAKGGKGQPSTASSLLAVIAASTERSTVFIVTTYLGIPFCMTSPKKPETSMLPKGDEGEPAEEALEPGVSVDGVHAPWARNAAWAPNCLYMALSSIENCASDSERGR